MFGTALLVTKLTLAPVPAARPRVSKWGTYYPPRYAKWKKAAEAEAASLPKVDDLDGARFLILDVVTEKARTSKRATPFGDVDNYAKAPMDAMNRAMNAWRDDDQVVGLLAFKRYAEPGEKPGTNIGVWNV